MENSTIQNINDEYNREIIENIFGDFYNMCNSKNNDKNYLLRFIRKFPEIIDWSYLSSHKISYDNKSLVDQYFFIEFAKHINWPIALKTHVDEFDFNIISTAAKYSSRADIIKYQCNFPESFIQSYIGNCYLTNEEIDWKSVSRYKCLSQNFVDIYKDRLDWGIISSINKYDENFIRKFKDYVDWNALSLGRKLSNSFIKEFFDKVNWRYISEYQNLSEDIIEEFKDRIYWPVILDHQVLSQAFIIRYKDKLFSKEETHA